MTFKQKIDNYWYYHKWHTICGAAAIAFLITATVQCMQKVEPDLVIGYIGSEYVETDGFAEDMSGVVGDINGDGREYVFCDNVTLPKEVKSEADMQMGQKLIVMFASGETKLFIAQREVLEAYADGLENLSGILPEDKLVDAVEYGGAKIAVSAAQCPGLKKYGLSGDDLYVAILSLWDEKDTEKHDASVRLIQEIVR